MPVEQDGPGRTSEKERPRAEGAVPVGVETDVAGPDGVRIVAVDVRVERGLVMRRLLEHSCAPEEIAEADSQAAAVELVGTLHPEVVVIEIQMPLAQGLDTIAALDRMSPRPRIVVCSFRRDAATMQVALAGGADAYVAKPASAVELRCALWPVSSERPPPRNGPPHERPVSPTLSQLRQSWREESG